MKIEQRVFVRRTVLVGSERKGKKSRNYSIKSFRRRRVLRITCSAHVKTRLIGLSLALGRIGMSNVFFASLRVAITKAACCLARRGGLESIVTSFERRTILFITIIHRIHFADLARCVKGICDECQGKHGVRGDFLPA